MNPATLTQNIEEGLRQQALSRAQRVKKHDDDSSNGGGDGSSHGGGGGDRDSTGGGETSMEHSGVDAAGSSGSKSHGTAAPPPEIELVFKPHPQDGDGAQPRYIKTTANATGFVIVSILSQILMTIALITFLAMVM